MAMDYDEKFEKIDEMVKKYDNMSDEDRFNHFRDEVDRFISLSDEDKAKEYSTLFMKSVFQNRFNVELRKIDLSSFISMMKVAIVHDNIDLIVESVQGIISTMEEELDKTEEKLAYQK